MLKVASCTVGRTVVRSYGHKSKFFRLGRLLLPFCIIMGHLQIALALRARAILSFKNLPEYINIKLRPKTCYCLYKLEPLGITSLDVFFLSSLLSGTAIVIIAQYTFYFTFTGR